MRRLFFVLLFFSELAIASDFYYYTTRFLGHYATPEAMCEAMVSHGVIPGPPHTYEIILTSSGGFCRSSNYSTGSIGFSKSDTNCSVGEVYDYELRQCIPEVPESDQCEAGNEALRISYAFLGDSPNPPSSICTAGCVHDYKGVLGVGMSEPTVPGLFKYWVKYESTETACEGETPQEDPPPAPDPDPSEPGDGGGSGDPDPETPNHCPPGYSPGPNTDTCFKNPDPDGGDGDGGTGGGDGGTGGGDGGTGGGDGGTGGGDGGTGGGDGGTGGNGGTGGGDGGTGGGDGGTGGNGGTGGGDGGTGGGTGGGDGGTGGTGEGEGEGEEGEEGEYSPGDGDSVCLAKPECSGDAIQCGIVDQQWRMRCEFEKAYDFPSVRGEIESELEGDKFKLVEGSSDIEVPSFLDMHARWLGGSTCPPDETISLTMGGGRTFALSYQPLCTAATSISPLIVIIATVLATLYIGRGASGD